MEKKAYLEYDPENEPVVLDKKCFDILLSQEKPSDLISLYSFYYYTAKWQKTNQVRSTTTYTAKGLKWSEDRVRKNKKVLIKLGFVEDFQKKSKTNRITGYYIKVNFIWTKASVRETQTLANSEGNSLREENTLNSLGEKNKLFSKKKKEMNFAPVAHNPTMSRRVEGSYNEKVDKRRKLGGIHKSEDFLLQIPTPIFEVINFWNHKPGLPTHKIPELVKDDIYKNPTKTIRNIVILLKKVFDAKYYSHVPGLMKHNERYSINQMKESIRRHHAVSTDFSYLPENKEKLKKLSLINFFYNSHVDKDFSLKIRSGFLYYLENEPKLAVDAVPEVKLSEKQIPYFEAIKLFFEKRNFIDPQEIKQGKSAAKNVSIMASEDAEHGCLNSIVSIRIATPYDWVRLFFETLYELEEDGSLDNGANHLALSKVKNHLKAHESWSDFGWVGEGESAPTHGITYHNCYEEDF